MTFQDDFQQTQQIIQQAKDILIVTHERPNADAIGSSLALYLGLKGIGKNVIIACPDPMIVEFSRFIGVNKIVQKIGKRNFVISLDYVEGSIEKVSYNIEGNKFNLVIEPREGFDTFSEEKVSFHHAGTPADVIVAVDTIHLGGLKDLYEKEKELFASKPLINIDRHSNNMRFGTINIVHPQASSTAELVYAMLDVLQINITQDIATNLLNAVYEATRSFTVNNLSPESFELAAAAVRAGGRRFPTQQKKEQISEELPKEETAVTIPPEHRGVPMHYVSHSIEQKNDDHQQQNQPQEAPVDWLRPKIFKSSNLG